RIKQPTRTADQDCFGFSPAPLLFGLAPGGVCRAVSVAGNAVRSYRTVSPLPRLNATRRGGLFSVALSLGFYPRRTLSGTVCPWSPDFPLRPPFRHWRGAAVRPTDPIEMGIYAYCVKVSCATASSRPEWVLSTRLCWEAVAQAVFRSTHVMSAAWKDRQRHRREPVENGAGMP